MNIALLGSTGSIGVQTLDVIRQCLPNTKVSVLTGYSNIDLLKLQIKEFKPDIVWVPTPEHAKKISGCNVLTGDTGLIKAASENNASIVVNALVGSTGLEPTIAAIKARKHIALANKETLVINGEYICSLAKKMNINIYPIDSEHSAVWQCLQGEDLGKIEKIILTCSGGPFRTWTKQEIQHARAKDALKHPNWNMGAKITIDSATLMNKGLELIEAMHLFNIPPEKIQILIHPESIIHSMVQFIDGSIKAQLGTPDMRMPILYALGGRIKNDFPRLDFTKSLNFYEPDMEKFPCLSLAIQAAKLGGDMPAKMNMANEKAVYDFLDDKIGFYDISDSIKNSI